MLYIVATPIGNLNDISYRQAKILAESEIILTEDTRSATSVLKKIQELGFSLSLNQKLISYYKEKEFEKLPQVLEWLHQEKNIALISESGMPLISDPGYLLIKNIIKQNLPFTVIPGATAVTTALLYSGFNPQNFMFLGFLPKKESEILRFIDKSKCVKQQFPETVFVIYDSPNRINETLKIIDTHWSNVDVCVCRELTKQFEEIYRGKAKDLKDKTYKGEITLLLT